MTQNKVAPLAGSMFANTTAQVRQFDYPQVGKNKQCVSSGFCSAGSDPSNPPPARMEYEITGQVRVDMVVKNIFSQSKFLTCCRLGRGLKMSSRVAFSATLLSRSMALQFGRDQILLLGFAK